MNNLPPAEFNAIVLGGSILAANAGFINVVSMAGIFPGVTVSHVTGTVSRIPISIIKGDLETFVLVVSIIISFAFGCFMAGFLVGESKFRLGRDYGLCLAIESGMLFASFLFLRSEFVLGEWCAAFAMGLQNAMASQVFNARTTHLTGLVTDIGNICGQACRKDSKAEVWRLKIHVPIFFGFLIGGFFGSVSWIVLREYSMLLPVILTGGSSFFYFTMPMIKEAQTKLHNATSLGHFQEIGNQLGIPGIELPIQKTGQFNHGQEGYKKQLDNDIKNFMADIDADQAEIVELQDVIPKNGHVFNESDSLLKR